MDADHTPRPTRFNPINIENLATFQREFVVVTNWSKSVVELPVLCWIPIVIGSEFGAEGKHERLELLAISTEIFWVREFRAPLGEGRKVEEGKMVVGLVDGTGVNVNKGGSC